jgi:hypothetical protein
MDGGCVGVVDVSGLVHVPRNYLCSVEFLVGEEGSCDFCQMLYEGAVFFWVT